ncbi:hypothetical protein A2619_01180 [candidate division WWE3 bacterium RIFOXYD1_FULL_39_9]|uniref:Uncharacterized protein n=1 Tax=candidate division WWE3 bacterium RIFOXYD1_FULL_39_9 TaxID=1802649 RepID=A0A1F4X692_UNCKA|nr:MAG: hypothetical protein A2619_01180 [candidate division WWE3 bacterium RIFOXYD1_FULL_39_9]
MKAYRVSGYGSTIYNIRIEEKEIIKETLAKVYFENTSENKITYDYYFPHRWFLSFREAVDFVKEKLNKMKKNLERVNSQIKTFNKEK